MEKLDLKLKEEVAKGRLQEAISSLKEHSCGRENEIYLIESRFLDLKKQATQQLATSEAIQVEKNKISKSLLELLDRLIEDEEAVESLNSWKDASISRYVQEMHRRYQQGNNFLYQEEKVPFWDQYHPLQAIHGKDTLSHETAFEQLEKYRCISVIGPAGSGKTSLLSAIMLKLIANEVAIPLFLEFRKIRLGTTSLAEFIQKKLVEQGLAKDEKQAEFLLVQGRFVLLLDGFDEWKGEVDDLYNEIEDLTSRYPQKFLVSSRQENGIDISRSFARFEMREFSEQDVAEFFARHAKDENELNRLSSYLKEASEEKIWYSQDDYRLAYLKNPLLLSLFMLSFRYKKKISKRRSDFYGQVLECLWEIGDKRLKNSFIRKWGREVWYSDLIEVLGYISLKTVITGDFAFDRVHCSKLLREANRLLGTQMPIESTIKALVTTSIWNDAEGKYSFYHRSLQDYLAVSYLKSTSKGEKEEYYNGVRELRVLGNVHFLSLLKEMDPAGYDKFVLLPFFESVYVDPKEDDRNKIIEHFLRIGDPQFGYELNDDYTGMEYTCSNLYTSAFTKIYSMNLDLEPPHVLNQPVVLAFKEIMEEQSGKDWMWSTKRVFQAEDLMGFGGVFEQIIDLEKMREYFRFIGNKMVEIKEMRDEMI